MATAAVIGVGMATDDEPHVAAQRRPAEVRSTPLEDIDTSTLVVRRAAFCDGVPSEAVAAALDAEPDDKETAYGNGERAHLDGRVKDVAHEFGCSWTARAGRARAWVFAPPVTKGLARGLVDEASSPDGCETLTDAPRFGRPTAALACADSGALAVSYRGLFGDAWLSCSVSGHGARDDLIDRAGRWCVAVAQAASGPVVGP